MYSLILAIHIILAVAITCLVLLQRGEGGLGGLGGSNSAANFLTSRQTGTLLSRLTKYFFICFVCTSLTLVIMARRSNQPQAINLLPDAPVTENPLTPNQPADQPKSE